jgi:ABC-2 type transport system ATP-binding protein
MGWRFRLVAGAVAVLLVAGLAVVLVGRGGGYRVHSRFLTVETGPHGTTPVRLDTSFYLPSGASGRHPVPAVMLAHGLGGSKYSVAKQAGQLAGHGYAVLTWTAQGFGASGGSIHLDNPDWEVTDARRLIDWLGRQPAVERDGPDDPRVGIVGGSYGGALALLTAGYDRRVDAIVPQITWNDLGTALFPESSRGPATDGVLKKAWLGDLFASGLRGAGGACGRFAATVCRMYQQVMTTGRADAGALALLRRSSPATVLDRIHAPTLLVQGLSDTLFGLDQADANARGIAATGTPVQVAWYSGGHDGGNGSDADHDRTQYLTLRWLDHYLRGTGPASTDFTYSRIVGYDSYTLSLRTTALSASRYPGLGGNSTRSVRLDGPPQRVANPPDGTPAAISTLPGTDLGGLGVGATEIPGQAADFNSATLAAPVDLAGAARVTLRVGGPGVYFAKLYDVDPQGHATLVAGQAAPFRVDSAGTVRVTLPGMVYRFAAGHRIRLAVDTADEAYATPPDPSVTTVAIAGGLTLPQVAGTPLRDPAGIWYQVLIVLVVLLAVAILAAVLVARTRRRRRQRAVDPELADVPLAVRGLRKTYRGGFVAVRGVDFTVRRNQVVGLLGPNGAGKTTTLRMVLGLIRPTAGTVGIFGHHVTAGAPVLSRIGSLVEGPGFLPHLSGVDNLRMYWRATGRPWYDARFDEVLRIAGLGDAVHRKVRTYSHGMRQRLAIAQAMLGLPDLLLLDEPTDGLDPPQIAELRRVLRGYATDGRSVLVSSHLLAEVEQTCTHVVVMRGGERVAAGTVAGIVGESPSVLVSVSDVDAAEPVLRDLPGVASFAREDGGFVVDLGDGSRRAMIAALVSAGVGVDRVVPRRRLEDAFLALLERED